MGLINDNCRNIPIDLANHIENEFSEVQKKFLIGDYQDLLTKSGRFCEAILRYFEWKTKSSYTAIDGKQKPGRNIVISEVRKCAKVEHCIKQQVASLVEIIMDFRNNRNAAHLGNINPNLIDAITVYQIISWIMAEIIRVESKPKLCAGEIQRIIDRLAERPLPIICNLFGNPIVLKKDIKYTEETLVLLYNNNGPVRASTLFKWTHHTNITRWRKNVLSELYNDRLIAINKDYVYILPTGIKRACEIISDNYGIEKR